MRDWATVYHTNGNDVSSSWVTPSSRRTLGVFVHPYAFQAEGIEAVRMVQVVRDSRADGMWLQMYSYPDEPRLTVLRDTFWA